MSETLALMTRFGLVAVLFAIHVVTSIAARQALGLAAEWRHRGAKPRTGGPDPSRDRERIAREWQTEADILTATASAAAVLAGAAAFWPMP